MLVELLLGDLEGSGEILVGQLRVDDFVAVLRQEGRFDASWGRLPAVEEENLHEGIVFDDRAALDGYNSTAPSVLQTAAGHQMETKLRVAVVQAAPVMFDTQRSLQKLADFTADAAKVGAGLVVFPEAFIAGYPKGHDFGVSVGIRSSAGRDDFRRLFESAIDVPGDATKFIGTVAKEHGVHLIVGVTERDGGTLFCTALFFGPDG